MLYANPLDYRQRLSRFFFSVKGQVVNTFDLQTAWPLPQVLSLPLINRTVMVMLKACVWCSFSHNPLTSGLITVIWISSIMFSCWQLYIWIFMKWFYSYNRSFIEFKSRTTSFLELLIVSLVQESYEIFLVSQDTMDFLRSLLAQDRLLDLKRVINDI